jgi:pimeloyl-ACP methyl ester carboxylesterase
VKSQRRFADSSRYSSPLEGHIPTQMSYISRFRKPLSVLGVVLGSMSALSITPDPASAATLRVRRAAFSKCAGGLECAMVKVPLDPSNPTGSKISIQISRRKAAKKSQRIGVLVINPGGPGATAASAVRDAERYVSQSVLDRFDLVGVDPRGTAKSTKIGCAVPSVPISQVAKFVTAEDAKKVQEQYAKIGEICLESANDLLPYINTTTNAHDLEAVRIALGENRISFLGMSYGTYVGAVYQSLFPDHTRSMVLDSALDPTRFGVSQFLDPVSAAETALDDFLAACTNGSLEPCAFNDGSDLKERFNTVRKKAAEGSEKDLGATNFDLGVASLIGLRRAGWPVLATALSELAADRKPTFALRPEDSSPTSTEDRSTLGGFSSGTNIATNCRDGILPMDESAFQELLDSLPAIGPRFTGTNSSFGSVLTCVDWPFGPVPQTALASGAASTLVVGNRWDLTTPVTWSKSVASQLGAAFIQRNGGGHVASDKSACIREITAKFFIDGAIPSPDTSCPFND